MGEYPIVYKININNHEDTEDIYMALTKAEAIFLKYFAIQLDKHQYRFQIEVTEYEYTGSK